MTVGIPSTPGKSLPFDDRNGSRNDFLADHGYSPLPGRNRPCYQPGQRPLSRNQANSRTQSQEMSVYFTSDHHFGHSGARSFYRRPFASVAEMDRQMIARWNSIIEPAGRGLASGRLRRAPITGTCEFSAERTARPETSHRRQQRRRRGHRVRRLEERSVLCGSQRSTERGSFSVTIRSGPGGTWAGARSTSTAIVTAG